jgi:hypothetical protein
LLYNSLTQIKNLGLRSLISFNQNVGSLEEFFLDVIDQRLVGKDKIDEKAYTFFGAQGP